MFTKSELEILKQALTIDVVSDQQQDQRKVQLLEKIESLIQNYQNIN